MKLQDQSVNLNSIFSEVKGELLIGGEKIKPELRNVLREQAKYLATSQLWEVFNNTAIQEANDLALKKSANWEHVLYAKALKYYVDIFSTMITKLKT